MPNTIAKHKLLMAHKAEIIQKFHQGIPVKVIADDEKVWINTIYHILIRWGMQKREKEEEIVSEDYTKEVVVKPFKERISPETLMKMKENTLVNQKLIKYYEWQENILPMKKILEGV